MIPRYTRPEMAGIWEPENRFRIWLQIELAACEAWNRLGRIPDDALSIIRERADFEVGRTTVSQVVVFSSQLDRSGPTYEALARAPLGGS